MHRCSCNTVSKKVKDGLRVGRTSVPSEKVEWGIVRHWKQNTLAGILLIVFLHIISLRLYILHLVENWYIGVYARIPTHVCMHMCITATLWKKSLDYL